jgi:hypothetical protein
MGRYPEPSNVNWNNYESSNLSHASGGVEAIPSFSLERYDNAFDAYEFEEEYLQSHRRTHGEVALLQHMTTFIRLQLHLVARPGKTEESSHTLQKTRCWNVSGSLWDAAATEMSLLTVKKILTFLQVHYE